MGPAVPAAISVPGVDFPGGRGRYSAPGMRRRCGRVAIPGAEYRPRPPAKIGFVSRRALEIGIVSRRGWSESPASARCVGSRSGTFAPGALEIGFVSRPGRSKLGSFRAGGARNWVRFAPGALEIGFVSRRGRSKLGSFRAGGARNWVRFAPDGDAIGGARRWRHGCGASSGLRGVETSRAPRAMRPGSDGLLIENLGRGPARGAGVPRDSCGLWPGARVGASLDPCHPPRSRRAGCAGRDLGDSMPVPGWPGSVLPDSGSELRSAVRCRPTPSGWPGQSAAVPRSSADAPGHRCALPRPPEASHFGLDPLEFRGRSDRFPLHERDQLIREEATPHQTAG